jgi:hypothetical protein
VLGEVLASSDDRSEALAAFTRCRYDRCRMVVETSRQLGEWEQNLRAETGRLSAELTERSWAALADPV